MLCREVGECRMQRPRGEDMLVLRSVFFTVVVPGTVTVLIPYLIVSGGRAAMPGGWRTMQYLAVAPIVAGAGILLRCIWDFARVGRGTLAPVDPPKELVVQGLYRYVRNPMYLGVLILLLGEATLFESVVLLQYAVGWLVVIHLVVVLYEEPTLRYRFGESYEGYCRTVRRWIPGKGMARATVEHPRQQIGRAGADSVPEEGIAGQPGS
jgi:protein-S-isoprenylcysteine O-methyltransferase Ste14